MPTDEQQKINVRNQAIDWLVKLRDNDISESEQHELADWLAQDFEHCAAFVDAENLFRDMLAAAETLNSPLSLSDFKPAAPRGLPVKSGRGRYQARRYRYWLSASLGIAAICLLAVTLVFNEQAHLFSDLFSDLHTVTGEQQETRLSDGSRLLLNTNSAVSIEYGTAARRIVLHHGQVRFIVARDAVRPFEVIAGNLKVNALGTIFEVYKNDNGETSVIVQEHSVAAMQNARDVDQTGGVTIAEGYRLVYRNGQTLRAPEPVKLDLATAWQSRKIVINDRPLSELIAELQRYRSGRIFLDGRQLENLRVSGTFSLNNPEDAVHAVSNALGLQEQHIGPWWTLLRN